MTAGNNSAAAADIERIVREVMARLPSAAEPAASAANRDATTLRITDRVVSLAALEGKLNGTGRVVIASGAVITPAAQDYLRECGVQVHRENCQSQSPGRATNAVVAAAETTFDAAGFVSSLRQRGATVSLAGAGEITRVISQLTTDILRSQHIALLLTDQPALAVCLANRTRGARAFSADNEEDVRRGMAAIGANLLVLEPRGRSLFQLTRLAAAFIDAESHECPAAYREALG
jgi:hypothetical protein